MFTSYAQNFEDVRLWRALRNVPNGRYIDIGAQDPIVDSVSRGFYEQGWRGLHVEPSPAYATKLRANRPDEAVLQSAAGARSQLLTFYEFSETGLSTADNAVAERHIDDGRTVTRIVVPCTTLASIFESFAAQEIHWLKIDVEGLEREVLRGWTGSTVRPWVVVVESTLPMTQIESHASWERLLTRRGYQFVCFDGLNRFYVAHAHPELVDAFATPPNVFDAFSLSGTATSSFTAVSASQIRQLEGILGEVEATQKGDAAEFSRKLAIQASLNQKQGHDLDVASAKLLELAQTLASRERSFAQSVESIRAESTAREDQIRQQLRVLEETTTAARLADRALLSRMTQQLQTAREDAVRVWDAAGRKVAATQKLQLQHQGILRSLIDKERSAAALYDINVRQRNYLRSVFESRSWWITAPIRQAAQLLRNLLRRPVVESIDTLWAIDEAVFKAAELDVHHTPTVVASRSGIADAVLHEVSLRRNLLSKGSEETQNDAVVHCPSARENA